MITVRVISILLGAPLDWDSVIPPSVTFEEFVLLLSVVGIHVWRSEVRCVLKAFAEF